ncbi:uncharacterized protein LOC125477755 [Pyrus x bretschneideri]|uniref:uncharacterized protein LOC125477755 n=1 Tax=Pyrus x bretschneideri TaxID=225117 RepID=UPI00202E3862|nr:uncharacterized protein LOC125477755 [Pyrus x bretschneideri]
MIWDLLYGEYHVGDQVRSVKLQNLRREFEYAVMRDDETLSGYLTRLNDLINQMKTFGEILSNEKLVQKVLISLSKPYDPICLVIENTKCLETVELYKGKPRCFNCDKFGHWARECNAAKIVQKANNANQVEMTGNLFYANITVTEPKVNGERYIDSGCSNHMTGNVELLVDVRTNIDGKVQMLTGDLVNVAGMGSLVFDTNKGKKHKLEPKSFKGVFVGCATCEKGYRVFDPLSKKLVLSRDVVFDEEVAWNWEENSESISLNTGSFIYALQQNWSFAAHKERRKRLLTA